jgi:glycosyltransferase involved in cell wall biosynthesis
VTVCLVLGTATGGVGAHVRSLALGLVNDGWDVVVCGPRATEDLFGFGAVGAEFREVHIGASGDPRAAVALRRATHGADLVHAHGLRAATVAVLSGRRPLVVTWHNLVTTPSGAGVRRRALDVGEKLVARRADVTLGASPDLVERVRRLGGRDVRFAPVAADPPQPVRSVEDVRRELAVGPGRPLIVSVGRLHPQKAHDILIRAAARWDHFAPIVVIAGDGPLEGELRQLIESEGAQVRLLGRRTDVADLLRAADVVVLASRWEARSLAAQEALQLGRALVTTDVGGMRELVGAAAVLIPPDDVTALADEVTLLLAEPDRRSLLQARTVARAATWPTSRDTVEQVEGVYRELLR